MTSLNGVHKQRLSVKENSNCEIANCKVLDKISHQGIFGGIIASLSAASSLKVPDLLFAFTFCKK